MVGVSLDCPPFVWIIVGDTEFVHHEDKTLLSVFFFPSSRYCVFSKHACHNQIMSPEEDRVICLC